MALEATPFYGYMLASNNAGWTGGCRRRTYIVSSLQMVKSSTVLDDATIASAN